MKNKNIDNNDENLEENIYESFNTKTQEDNDLNASNTKWQYKEKEYNNNYLEEHTVVTRASKVSKLILYGFYLLIVIIGVVVFFMLRADRYEFYLIKDEVSISTGSSYQVELRPKNERYFDYLNYKYEIDDKSVATVDEYGTVTAVGSGTTTLKISLSPGFNSKKMRINSTAIEINSLSLMVYKDNKLQKGNTVTMNPNQTITLKAIANNNGESFVDVGYKSSNEIVAIVDEFGNVTAKSEGEAKIVGTKDNVSGEITIKVVKKATSSTTPTTPTTPSTPKPTTPTPTGITKVDIGTNQVTKYVGDTISLTASITPSTATAKSITWASSNTKVATVTQQGVVKAVGKGTAVIVVNADGIRDTCTIIVKKKDTTQPPTPIVTPPAGTQISAKEVNLSNTSLTVNTGKTATFTIKVSGAAGLISVSSSNSSVATVSVSSSDCNGLKCFFDAQTGKESSITYTVKGIKSGTAYINVSLDDVVSYDEKTITGSGKVGILVK